jgi:hypothetical protein
MASPFLSHSARAVVVVLQWSCCGDRAVVRRPVFQGRATACPAVLPLYDVGVGTELVRGLLDEVGLPATLSERGDLVGARWGRCPPSGGASTRGAGTTSVGDLTRYETTSVTPYGRLRHLGPVARLPATPGRWEVATSPIGTSAPAWMPARAAI